MTGHPEYRRHFIRIFMGLVAAPLAGVWFGRLAHAVEMVSETDPQAVDLDYKADATQAKKRTDPTAICSNCKFYASAPGEASGSCAILLPRKHVAAGGWCAAWIKRG